MVHSPRHHQSCVRGVIFNGTDSNSRKKGLPMAEREHLADKLLLVTEMLQAAAEYLTAAHTIANDDDSLMARLAYEHVLTLRNRIAQLNKKVDGLEADLRRKLLESTAETPPTRSKPA